MPKNLYTGTDNDPFQQAQHQYNIAWEPWFKAVKDKRVNLGGIGQIRQQSLGMPAEPGVEDIARSGAINAYLGDLSQTGLRGGDPRNPALDQVQDEYIASLRQSDAERAMAIANDPNTSARGRPIAQREDGSYTTLRPNPNDPQEPVNRQAIAAQMAPGQIPPPAAPVAKPVTYDAPIKAVVNGKVTMVRPGSDGLTYDMARRPIDPAAIQPVPDKATGPLETIIGPEGKPIRVRQEDAIGKEPAAGTMKASTGVQKRVLNFFNRAQQADTELEGMEAQIQELGLVNQGRLALAPNVFQSQLGQSYGAAQRAFTEARLRKDSGAAIPEQEFDNDRKTYFAQPGDSAATLEQKRRARGAILSSLGFESGQALGEFVGDEDEAKRIVQGYKDRAAGKATGGGGVAGSGKGGADPLGIR